MGDYLTRDFREFHSVVFIRRLVFFVDIYYVFCIRQTIRQPMVSPCLTCDFFSNPLYLLSFFYQLVKCQVFCAKYLTCIKLGCIFVL